jgi:glycolate oxidase iron-sulfur subunit
MNLPAQAEQGGAAAGPITRAGTLIDRCVHCGFCNAVCPTYAITGDEREGPRGRIYQIRLLLEDNTAAGAVRPYLDHCLNCRACESVCPSGVEYHAIADLGRQAVEAAEVRPRRDLWLRRSLAFLLLQGQLLRFLVRLHGSLRPLLPRTLRQLLPEPRAARQAALPLRSVPPASAVGRRVAILSGCVQGALAPQIDLQLEALMRALGWEVEVVQGAGCCGALPHHLGAVSQARSLIEGQILALEARLDAGVELCTQTATGCLSFIRDYPSVLADDPAWQARARRIVTALRDPVELLADLPAGRLRVAQPGIAVALQAPCSLQHGGAGSHALEQVLTRAGARLVQGGGGACCGSAGAYSLLHPATARRLRDERLDGLLAHGPAVIATANIGCMTHLQAGTATPVHHWLELLVVEHLARS